MAATPFKGIVQTMQPNGAAGPSFRFSADDVAGNLVTFDDLGDQTYFQLPAGLRLANITVSAAGVDTKALQIRRGTADTEHILRDAVLVETVAVEPRARLGALLGAPLRPGAQYGFKQLA